MCVFLVEVNLFFIIFSNLNQVPERLASGLPKKQQLYSHCQLPKIINEKWRIETDVELVPIIDVVVALEREDKKKKNLTLKAAKYKQNVQTPKL